MMLPLCCVVGEIKEDQIQRRIEYKGERETASEEEGS